MYARLSGGHFPAGAWVLVLLYDYHHGADFAREGLELRPPLCAPINDDLARRGGQHAARIQ